MTTLIRLALAAFAASTAAACGNVISTSPDAGETDIPDSGVETDATSADAGSGDGVDSGTPSGSLQFNDLSKDLGSVTVGQQGVEFVTMLRNRGSAPVGPLAVSTSGAADHFLVDASACAGSTLSPDGECAVKVTFRPQSPGAQELTLSITDQDDMTVAASIAITGTGLSPSNLQITPPTFAFERTRIGAPPARHTFMVANRGDTAVSGLTFDIDGSDDYTVDRGTCTAQLAGNATCELEVVFTPTAGGARTGSVVVSAGDRRAASALSGTGVGTVVITKTGDGADAGVVTADGLACSGATCTAEVAASSLRARATIAGDRGRFMNWSTSCDRTADCDIPVTARTTVSANFRAVVLLSVATSGNGAGAVSGPGIACPGSSPEDCREYVLRGESVTLRIAPSSAAASRSRNGTIAGCDQLTSDPQGHTCTVTMSSAKTISTPFIRIVRLAVTKTGTAGELRGAGLVVNDGTTRETFVDTGTRVTVSASGNPADPVNSVFDRWSGPCNDTSPQCSFDITADTNVSGSFKNEYGITVTVTGGAITRTPLGYNCGVGRTCYNQHTSVTVGSTAPRCATLHFTCPGGTVQNRTCVMLVNRQNIAVHVDIDTSGCE